MKEMAAFAERLVADKLISGGNLFWLEKNRLGAGLLTLSGGLFLSGLGLLVFSAFLWLQNRYAPDAVAALTGLILISIASLFSLCAFILFNIRNNRSRKLAHEIEETFTSMIEILDRELEEPVGKNPKVSVLLASIAGFAAGNERIHA